MSTLISVSPTTSTVDTGKVRLGAYAPSLSTTDGGKVRLGAYAPSLSTADAGKVRLGAYAPSLSTTDAGKVRLGAYAPSFASQKWLERFSWMDTLGQRWWPIFGAMYCVVAVKRVRGMRLLEPGWRARRTVAAAPAAVASKDAASHSS